ncbi:MAG: hypothetical protein ACFFCS_24045 [Candidatus Hodarchaeota archaeon]
MYILKCVKCSFTQELPEGAGKPMRVVNNLGQVKLVYSEGTKSNVEDYPVHCKKEMRVLEVFKPRKRFN